MLEEYVAKLLQIHIRHVVSMAITSDHERRIENRLTINLHFDVDYSGKRTVDVKIPNRVGSLLVTSIYDTQANMSLDCLLLRGCETSDIFTILAKQMYVASTED